MRGGVRAGAGRKPSEPTVRVRIPESLLPQVQALIDGHKKTRTEIKLHSVPMPDVPTSEVVLKAGPEIKRASVEIPLTPAQRETRKQLERLPKEIQVQIKADFGTFTQAVRAGVLVRGKIASKPNVS